MKPGMCKGFLIFLALSSVLIVPAFAKEASPLLVRAARQAPAGVDRVFSFTIANQSDRAVAAHGRVVVINVYGAGPAVTLPVEETVVPPNGTAEVAIVWHDAPIIGQIRATLILNESTPTATIASASFWLLPNVKALGGGAAGLALGLVLIHFAMRPRTPKKAKAKTAAKKTPKAPVPTRVALPMASPTSTQSAPSPKPVPAKPIPPPKPKPLTNMLAYVIEPDDTIMTLSSRFDVSWQDLARANRLKPPYALVPGRTLQIPRHALKPKPPLPQA